MRTDRRSDEYSDGRLDWDSSAENFFRFRLHFIQRPAERFVRMAEAQTITIVLSTVPTFLVVLIGLLLNNSRLNDLRTVCGWRSKRQEQRLVVGWQNSG